MHSKIYNPIERADKIRKIVVKGNLRKYYRVQRADKWYGGISTADCCGCNLKCVFCWSNKPRDNPDKIGKFHTPEEIFSKILSCAKKHRYRLLRISGNEPTISKEHILKILKLVDKTDYLFILETNGTLIDEEFAYDLSQFKNVHVRVSLKGTNREEFTMLTEAIPETFDIVLNNIKNLVAHKVNHNIAVMLSFSPESNIAALKERLKKISPSLLRGFEEEYVFLYPHVIQRLKKAEIKPLMS